MRKILSFLFTVIMLLSLTFMVVSCKTPDEQNKEQNQEQNQDEIRDYIEPVYKTYVPTLSVASDKVVIGVEGVQEWVFKKTNDSWLFDGVYAINGKDKDRVFVGASGKLDNNEALLEDGYYFSVLSTSNANGIDKQVVGLVKEIIVSSDSKTEKIITLKGKGFESTLKVDSTSQFVERKINIQPQTTMDILSGDISFVLRGKVDEYTEYGYILSRKSSDEQYSLPYSFPAIAGKLTRIGDSNDVYTYMNVIDYYNTADCFKTARRRVGLNGFFEEGILSSEGTIYTDSNNAFVERVCVRTGNNDSFYDLIYDTRYEYGQIYNLDVATLVETNSNMNVYDWDEAAYGATYDLMDSRGRPLGDEVGTWGPYGYQNGGGESFGAMNILKGMIRYAKATSDQELYDFAMKFLLQMVTPDPVYGKCYVMPRNNEPALANYSNDYFFFLGCFNGGASYSYIDSYMGASAVNFGSFKYYSRVLQLGELALLTDNVALKNAYLKLMVLVKKLRLEDFSQPVEWGHDNQPKLDYENGGSSGAEAMWAYCMYLGAQITTNQSEKTEYLNFMQKATDLANKQGFERSSSLRDAPKPETSGYLVRVNILLYQTTKNKEYLNYALTAAQGIYFFYFHNSHPYTYFQTLGYGYACAHERWEAFMEMVESLELLVPIFEYTNDPLLYELFMTLRESALSALPVNGYPEGVLGGHSDWLDALYVPFEQPTGVLGDNGLQDGGAASYRRWSKEQYGMGEIYLGALMYSTQGKAADPKVLVLNYTSTWLHCSRIENSYKIYNFGESGSKVVSFPNYDNGIYSLTVNGVVKGNYTSEQLKNGIVLRLEKETPIKVQIAPSENAANQVSLEKSTSIDISNLQSNRATVTVNAANAVSYRIYVSRTADFDKYTTSVKFSEKNVFELGFEDSSLLYVKAVAYDANGNAYKPSTTVIESNDVNIGVQDDFSSIYLTSTQSQLGWMAQSTYYKGKIALGTDLGDFIDYAEDNDKYRAPMGYMAIYKPAYAGYDIDTFTKSYVVDLDEYPLFDFYPFTKNYGSQFTLKVEIDGKQYTLIDKVNSFNVPSYRFDLSEIAGVTGEKDIKVILVSEGFNRGFALTKLRFVSETNYNADYDLTNVLNFAGTATIDNSTGALVIENGNNLVNTNTIALPAFNPEDYKNLEILVDGITTQQDGFIRAIIEFIENGNVASSVTVNGIRNKYGIKSSLDNFELSADKQYFLNVKFMLGSNQINNVSVLTVRLTSDKVATTTSGFDEEAGYVPVVKKILGKWQMVNGWSSNWAFANTEDGYISNENANVNYGSIYKSGIMLDLDETPVIRFTVSGNKNNTSWSLKVNDGTLPVDLVLYDGDGSGTFEANIKDVFKRSGIVSIRLDFYVIHDKTTDSSKGVFFDGYAFVEGLTLYENIAKNAYTVTTSDEFTVNTSVTDYLVVDIPEHTYGSTWLIYLVDSEGREYELKTVYECVYSKMYSREKEGVFKFQLSDILPDEYLGKDCNFTLKIILDGENSHIKFGSIRLVTDNDVNVLQQACKIR